MNYGHFSPPLVDIPSAQESRKLLIEQESSRAQYPDVQIRIAEAFYAEGNLVLALEWVRKALSKNSDYLRAQLFLVKILCDRGDFSLARETLYPVRLRNDEYADVLCLYAQVLFFLGEHAAALNELRQAVEVNRSFILAQTLQLIIYHREGRVEEYLDMRARLEKQGIHDGKQHFINGLISYEKQHIAEGVVLFEAACALGFKSALSAYNASCGYSRLTLFERAKPVAEQAIHKDSALREVMVHDEDFRHFWLSSFGAQIRATF